MKNGFVEKMFREVDRYYKCHNMNQAGICMEYWLAEAQKAECWQEELTILNELIGYYRKMGDPENGFRIINQADMLIHRYGLEDHEASGTTWLNIATAYRAFGKAQKSYDYFMKTKKNYESRMDSFDYRMASLHNNIALLFLDTGYLEKAEEEFLKAEEILRTDEESGAELATTYVNMIVLYHRMDVPAEKKETLLNEIVDKTMELLTKYKVLPDSYYAYVCDISAKTLSSLGKHREADILKKIAEEYYMVHREKRRPDK